MTRKYIQLTHCPKCGCEHTTQTAFGRWISEQDELDSRKGYCVVDQDWWIHKFKTFRGREFQLIMGVEIKTRGAKQTLAQKDTYHMVNQVMRNRRETPTKPLRYQSGSAPVSCFSIYMARDVLVRFLGMHVLRFSGTGPRDSDSIWWDKKKIDEPTLLDILKFNRDPDTLGPIKEILRNHHTLYSDQLNLW